MSDTPITRSRATSAYIHVPFCIHRCGYCDFTVVADRDDLVDAYLDSLSEELKELKEKRSLKTLFLGGGTPTYFEERDLARLMSILGQWFDFEKDYEWSVEANPAGLTREKIAILSDAGVNRISLGVQSFDEDVLKFLERDHREKEIYEACENVKSKIGNLAIDLIFAVPGQSLKLWQETLNKAVSLETKHISTYGLTIEKGTSFWSRVQKKEFFQVEDDLQSRMYEMAMDQLPEAGLAQYELSNFAREGYSCRHNEVYWQGEDFFGFGPGAASLLEGQRRTNHRSVTAWIRKVLNGESAVHEVDELDKEERAREKLVVGLRLCRGVEENDFQSRTGYHWNDLAGEEIEKYVKMGLLEMESGRLRLTRSGRMLADSITVDLI